ncbi:Sema [Chamberlinius hualienensis]
MLNLFFKKKRTLTIFGFSFIMTFTNIKTDQLFCHKSFASNEATCSRVGQYKVESVDECCLKDRAAGFSKTYIGRSYHSRQVACQSCSTLFNKTKHWCFGNRNHKDGTCTYMPSSLTLESSSEVDCFLWRSAFGYSYSPKWKWSHFNRAWITPCNTSKERKVVVCYFERDCTKILSKFAESLDDCCKQSNVKAFTFLNWSTRKTLNCQSCPIHGGWSQWSGWSVCSTTCDTGVRKRLRECNSPLPQYGGINCTGDPMELENCNHVSNCTDDGWSQWSSLTPCGAGYKTSLRRCQINKCEGLDYEQMACYTFENSIAAIGLFLFAIALIFVFFFIFTGIFYCKSKVSKVGISINQSDDCVPPIPPFDISHFTDDHLSVNFNDSNQTLQSNVTSGETTLQDKDEVDNYIVPINYNIILNLTDEIPNHTYEELKFDENISSQNSLIDNRTYMQGNASLL